MHCRNRRGYSNSSKEWILCSSIHLSVILVGWILWLVIIFSGEGNGTPLQYSCLENPMDGGAWWVAVHGVTKSRTWLSIFTFTFHFHALEKEMATYSSVLAWRIPGMGKPGELLSMGSHRVWHDWNDLAKKKKKKIIFFFFKERLMSALPCSFWQGCIISTCALYT